jgi:hypothetical protein
MFPTSNGVGPFSVLLLIVAVLFLCSSEHVTQVSGAMWLTVDRAGRQVPFDIPPNHPAFLSRGKDAAMWHRTEYFVERERNLRRTIVQNMMLNIRGAAGAAAGMRQQQLMPNRRALHHQQRQFNRFKRALPGWILGQVLVSLVNIVRF